MLEYCREFCAEEFDADDAECLAECLGVEE